MRQVDRSSVIYPNRLQIHNLTPININQLNDHTKISSSVYRHQDVKDSLKGLYFEKCYICESDVTGCYKVEHYLPKKYFPKLGYTWSNLHKSCEGCNLAKEQKDFLIKDENDLYTDINLLDPSNSTYNIKDYMRFDVNSIAELVSIGTDPYIIEKAKNTIKYLNGQYKSEYGKDLKYRRENRGKSFLQFFISNIIQYREIIESIKNAGIPNYIEPLEPIERGMHQKLCLDLIKLDQIYLCDAAPFSTCTRVQMIHTMKIPYSDLLCMKEKMREILDL